VPGTRHIYHKFVIKTGQRDALASHLKGAGVEVMVHYPSPLHAHPLFAESLPKDGVHSPVAENLAASVLSLPMHPWLTDVEVDFVVRSLAAFMAKIRD